MKAGGQLLEKERAAERKKEAIRMEEKKRQRRTQEGAATDYNAADLFNSDIKSEPELLDIIFKAVRFFRRL